LSIGAVAAKMEASGVIFASRQRLTSANDVPPTFNCIVMLDTKPHSLSQAIADKSAKVGVVGLGYVGLPLIRAFSMPGFERLVMTSTNRRYAAC
jgi:hypothetical protein